LNGRVCLSLEPLSVMFFSFCFLVASLFKFGRSPPKVALGQTFLLLFPPPQGLFPPFPVTTFSRRWVLFFWCPEPYFVVLVLSADFSFYFLLFFQTSPREFQVRLPESWSFSPTLFSPPPFLPSRPDRFFAPPQFVLRLDPLTPPPLPNIYGTNAVVGVFGVLVVFPFLSFFLRLVVCSWRCTALVT